MKKLISFLLVIVTLVSVPLQVTAADTADGTNGAKLKQEWNSATGTLTLTVISNGQVRMTVE